MTPQRPTLGLALIARDEESSLPRLLKSVEGCFDRVVLIDTGSTDNTKAVFTAWALEENKRQEAAGALAELRTPDGDVLPFSHCGVFEWCDDFSAARQVAHDALGPVDWCVWADCDDEVLNAGHLRALAAAAPPEAAGFIFPYDYAHDDVGNVICRLERERLVRKGIGESWQLPIHEVLQVPGNVVRSDAVRWIHHRDPEKGAQDPERNFTILSADYERSVAAGEDPNPRTLIYLGTECLALARPAEAIGWLERYLAVGEWDEELCQAAHKLAIALRLLADSEETPDDDRDGLLARSERAAHRAIGYRPDWADGYLDLAELALRREQPDKALRFIEQAKRLGTPQTLLIVNPLDYSYAPGVMESIALTKLGRIEEAFALTHEALRVTPGRPDLVGQFQTLADEVKARETEKHVLALRELLVRHDENYKALELLEAVPYYIYDRPAIADARRDQREMVLHATDPDVYDFYYRGNPNEAPFEWQGVPIEDAHETFRRVAFLREGLAEQRQEIGKQRLRVLDLSGNDGWVVANLSTQGFDCDMLEMNPDCVTRAKKRKRKYRTLGRVECGNLYDAPDIFEPGSYDAVVCFETIEHVPDTGALLDTMARMVRPGGRCYVSTPEGAYERGQDPIMAGWRTVESKGHLRAIRPVELAGWLCERGIVDGFELQQRLIHASFTPRPPKGRVVFYAGAADALPEKITGEGLGGSETALCKMAEQFAKRGYDVRVYAGQSDSGLRGDHVTTGAAQSTGQVLYQTAAAWDPGLDCDLFVSSRIPEAFDRTIKARHKVLWLHDADYGDRITEERAARCDQVIVLSEFQRSLFEARYPFLYGRLWVSANAIEPEFFADPLPLSERKPWVVYSSSPDRGLDVLLECWPEIRARVPDAELHYGYVPFYQQAVKAYPHLREFHRRIERLAAGQDGLVNFGSLGQRELAKLYGAARVWAYPSWNTPGDAPFPEISCISAMECQAAGCVPVCRDYAALKETVISGSRIDASLSTEAWRAAFIADVALALTDDDWWQKESLRGRSHVLAWDWSGVCEDWERRFIGVELPVAA